jgi:exodeoxyribonuclease VII small subunit
MKYEEAIQQLETIVSNMENDSYDIDQLSAKLKEAQKLIKTCRDKLRATEDELKKAAEK